MKKVLIAGGAGYIGSHMVKWLSQRGLQTVTVDNLSSGHRDAVQFGEFIQLDLADRDALRALFASHHFDAVMHFASSIQVGESVQKPSLYYANNVVNTLILLDEMRAAGVNRFIFSSTAATFGEPKYTPIDEKHPQQPLSPYGRSKLMVEQILEDYERAYGLRSVCLRYFNAAGADPAAELGERHDPETHLIPIALEVAGDLRPQLSVFGTDYDTPDGTCIRDYVHIVDLCQAHGLALDRLLDGKGSGRYNLGNGQGFSVRQVIGCVEQVCGRKLKVAYGDRRAGDPAVLVADATLARQGLGWVPEYADLGQIVSHAWAFMKRHRNLAA
ncbi:UDP-galactose-4-epimerase [beta proteobacterium AAP99]|nr:UDP-galactose-4-epimerase [beta proteobacterium AAP99]